MRSFFPRALGRTDKHCKPGKEARFPRVSKRHRDSIVAAVMSLLLMALVLPLLAGCAPDSVYTDPTPGLACRWDFPSSADGLPIPCPVYLP